MRKEVYDVTNRGHYIISYGDFTVCCSNLETRGGKRQKQIGQFDSLKQGINKIFRKGDGSSRITSKGCFHRYQFSRGYHESGKITGAVLCVMLCYALWTCIYYVVTFQHSAFGNFH